MKSLAVGFAFLILALAGCSAHGINSSANSLQIKPQLIHLETLDGQIVPLLTPPTSAKLTLVHFWASWCSVCGTEMLQLSQLYRKLHEDGLEIVGVAVSDTADKVKRATRQSNLSFPLLIDSNSEAWRAFQLESIPTTIVFDQDGQLIAIPDPDNGILRNRFEGPRGWQSAKVVRELEELLKKD